MAVPARHARNQPSSASPLTSFIRWLQLKNYQYEVTFSLYMLTSTEKVVFNSILFVLISLLVTAAYLYLPAHILIIYSRVWYYISGDFLDSTSLIQNISVPMVNAKDVMDGVAGVLKATKEVVVSQTATAIIGRQTQLAGRVAGAAHGVREEL